MYLGFKTTLSSCVFLHKTASECTTHLDVIKRGQLLAYMTVQLDLTQIECLTYLIVVSILVRSLLLA